MDFLNSNGLEVNAGKTTLTEYMTHQKRSKLRGIPPELTVTELVRDRLVDSHITDSSYCRFSRTEFEEQSWLGSPSEYREAGNITGH